MADQLDMDFDGHTYNHARDGERLRKQLNDVQLLMSDGAWRTLKEISDSTGHPQASVSARLRDFRKEKFGGHTVEREYLHDGLWRYRVLRRLEVGTAAGLIAASQGNEDKHHG